jgi:hypothetical protein
MLRKSGREEAKSLERGSTLIFSSIKNESFGGSKFWLLVVDDYTDYCWSLFLKYKADLKDKMFNLLTDLKIAGIEVKYICCDDSGENKSFMRLVGQMDI